jgi:hypothetical protein
VWMIQWWKIVTIIREIRKQIPSSPFFKNLILKSQFISDIQQKMEI